MTGVRTPAGRATGRPATVARGASPPVLGAGLLAPGAGLLAQCVGLLAQCVGLLALCAGLLALGAGLLCPPTAAAADGGGLVGDPATTTAAPSSAAARGFATSSSAARDPATSAAYANDFSAPWTRSRRALADFLSSEHLDYDLDGWYFFGNLVERSGRRSAFMMAVQRIDETIDGIPVAFVPAIVGYYNPSLGRYVYGGCLDIDVPPLVTVTQDPWKVTVVCALDPTRWMSMELVSGTMGRPGATYLLRADLTDQFGERLTAKVTLRDRIGALNDGYGPRSFYPQWITPLQRLAIGSDFKGSMNRYLRATLDPMAGQGSYYYSLGLMDVRSFRIGVASRTRFATGDRGTFWMDYLVESYDKTAQSVVADASWLFFALQFPSRDRVMLVNQLDTGAGRLRIARLFRKDSATFRNGSHKAVAQWDSDDIRITPVRGSTWTSKASGLTYPMTYRIRLKGPYKARRGVLYLKTVRRNQEIVVGDTVKYEGLMTVTGMLGGKRIRGTAWAELQPVGHL